MDGVGEVTRAGQGAETKVQASLPGDLRETGGTAGAVRRVWPAQCGESVGDHEQTVAESMNARTLLCMRVACLACALVFVVGGHSGRVLTSRWRCRRPLERRHLILLLHRGLLGLVLLPLVIAFASFSALILCLRPLPSSTALVHGPPPLRPSAPLSPGRLCSLWLFSAFIRRPPSGRCWSLRHCCGGVEALW